MLELETLRVVHVGSNRRVLAVTQHPGEATRVVVPLRMIIADALRLGSSGLLLSHNHPMGDPTPSRDDLITTRRLADLAHALGIRLHDHLIWGHNRHISFRAAGLL